MEHVPFEDVPLSRQFARAYKHSWNTYIPSVMIIAVVVHHETQGLGTQKFDSCRSVITKAERFWKPAYILLTLPVNLFVPLLFRPRWNPFSDEDEEMGYVTLQFCFRQPWWQDLAFSWVRLKPTDPQNHLEKMVLLYLAILWHPKGDTGCFVKCTPSYHETGITWL